jgi:hypothetical protein
MSMATQPLANWRRRHPDNLDHSAERRSGGRARAHGGALVAIAAIVAVIVASLASLTTGLSAVEIAVVEVGGLTLLLRGLAGLFDRGGQPGKDRWPRGARWRRAREGGADRTDLPRSAADAWR